MKTRSTVRALLIAALSAQFGCSSKAVAPADGVVPEATEPLPLTFVVRSRMPAEHLPRIEVSGLFQSVRVEIARPSIGCTIGTALVGRKPGVLTFVARVGGDPAALCEGGTVVEYEGVIHGVERGTYTVHVYEAVGDGPPVRLGTRSVAVLPGA
jgi:hypothetical protein